MTLSCGLPLTSLIVMNLRVSVLSRLCPLDASLPDDAMIPGLAMFTARAEPLATWMTGLEVAYFKVNRLYRSTLHACQCSSHVVILGVRSFFVRGVIIFFSLGSVDTIRGYCLFRTQFTWRFG